jgi:hypothetical protein
VNGHPAGMKGTKTRFLQCNSDKSPLASVIGTYIVGNKEKFVRALCMMDRVRMLSGGIVGVEYVGAEEGGPVYMIGSVEILSPKDNDAIPLLMTNEMERGHHSILIGLANGILKPGWL